MYGNAIATNVPFVVGPNGLSPYDFVSATNAAPKTASLTIRKASTATFNAPATFTFVNTAAVGATGMATGVGEFTGRDSSWYGE